MAVFPGTATSYGPEPDESEASEAHEEAEPDSPAGFRAGTITTYHSDPALHEKEPEKESKKG